MTATREQTNVMIAYLFQVMFERGEILRREATGSKEAERHANIIHSLARSIAILREDYGLYDRAPLPDDAAPEPQTDANQEQDTTDAPQEEPEEPA